MQRKSTVRALVATAFAALLAAGCGNDDDPVAVVPTPTTITLQKIGSTPAAGEGYSEIPAFDPASSRLFVVNGALGTVDVFDLADPTAPAVVSSIDVSALGGGVNSVAVARGIVALAIQGFGKTDQGVVAFYRASDLQYLGRARVGALPDMVTFTPDGRHVLVANEGEPNDAYTTDPEGSISIVDASDPARPTVRTADFIGFNNSAATLRSQGVRIFGPGASVAQDLEPEYIAVSADGKTAWVTLQENNALAVVDVEAATVTAIVPLGYKDHSAAGNALDASDRDGPSVNVANWPVLGMYQPDAIAAFTVAGSTYLITANEGDARDYAGFAEESRVEDLILSGNFVDVICGGPCAARERLGRLTVTTTLGETAAGSGVYADLYAFGARSFSIWSSNGALVYDSGDELEQRTAALAGNAGFDYAFNASNDNNSLDNRSDNKGPEPEGVAIGKLGDKTFAFIGLERVGGIMVFDVSDPAAPSYVTYINTRQGAGGDLGPEGLVFVPAADSPNGKPLLIVGFEISGNTVIYQIDQVF